MAGTAVTLSAMSLTGPQVSAHFANQAQRLGQMIGEHEQLLDGLQKSQAGLVDELAQAKRELAAVYLPALAPEHFERAAKLTGFQGFKRRDPMVAMVQERKVLEASLARLDGDDRYGRRETLLGPSGMLQQELDMAAETLAPLAAECERFELLPDFLELIECGYDTPAFSDKWWHGTYWKRWAAGDRICKQLELNDFGDDVIPAYRKYAEPRDVMRADVERLQKELDTVHELVREHDRVADRLGHLDEIYLVQSQDFLGEHLEHADLALLEQWIAPEPELARAVQIGLRKIAALQAKQQFMGEMGQTGVPQLVGQLRERMQKANAKATKFARPKYAYQSFADATVHDDFEAKAQALAAQREKIQRRSDQLIAARNYGGFDLANDRELWWMYLMSSPPPRYAPGLYDYYQRRPGAVALVDPDWVDMGPNPNVARAFVAGDLEREGYLS